MKDLAPIRTALGIRTVSICWGFDEISDGALSFDRRYDAPKPELMADEAGTDI